MTLNTQQRQAIAAVCSALVTIAALWGLNLQWLNEPNIQALIVAAVTTLVSLFVPNAPPSEKEAYRVVEKANQARDVERWSVDRDAGGLLNDDGFRRPEPGEQPHP